MTGVSLLENGTADPYYQRFISPKQNALILGNSKAAHGIVPAVLNEGTNNIYDVKIYNYSFSLYSSPYGPSYNFSIFDKLESNNKFGYFIVTVDPWSISSIIESPNDEYSFVENHDFISSVMYENNFINFEYLLNWFYKSYYEILLSRIKSNLAILHDDGWMESIGLMDNESVLSRENSMEKFYCRYLNLHSYSETRMKYLIELLIYLKRRGDVFLVRMPLDEKFYKIDNSLDPQFNLKMNKISAELEIKYYDFNLRKYNLEFKDGVHLNIESARVFSKILLDSLILKNNNE